MFVVSEHFYSCIWNCKKNKKIIKYTLYVTIFCLLIYLRSSYIIKQKLKMQ